MEDQPETQAQQLFELPDFEGQKPVGVVTRLNGAGQRITRPIGIGERGVLVVEYENIGVNHLETKDGIKRVHTLSVKDLYEVEGKTGLKLLSNMRLQAKQQEDDRAGRMTLDVDPKTDHGLTLDENGTALTDDEVAEAKGETPDLLQGEEPGVLVFADKSRALWPADYAGSDFSTPYAGDFIPNPNLDSSEPMQIMQVLDVETGDVLEEWTDELENERLLEMEEKAKTAEAAAAKKPAKKKKAKATESNVAEVTTPVAVEPELPAEEGQA
jgi:hypothetical protein